MHKCNRRGKENAIQKRHPCCLKQELFQELNFSKLIFWTNPSGSNSNKLTFIVVEIARTVTNRSSNIRNNQKLSLSFNTLNDNRNQPIILESSHVRLQPSHVRSWNSSGNAQQSSSFHDFFHAELRSKIQTATIFLFLLP